MCAPARFQIAQELGSVIQSTSELFFEIEKEATATSIYEHKCFRHVPGVTNVGITGRIITLYWPKIHVKHQ